MIVFGLYHEIYIYMSILHILTSHGTLFFLLIWKHNSEMMKGILGIERRPLVSMDYVNESRSVVVDCELCSKNVVLVSTMKYLY